MAEAIITGAFALAAEVVEYKSAAPSTELRFKQKARNYIEKRGSLRYR